MARTGVDDPERMFSAVIAQDADVSGGEGRTVDDTEEPAAADAEQRSAVMPTGGPSNAGPGAAAEEVDAPRLDGRRARNTVGHQQGFAEEERHG